MATYVTNVTPLAGLNTVDALLTASTPATGDLAATGTGVFLLVRNTGTLATFTIPTPGTIEGDLTPLPSRVVTVPATTGYGIIPLTDVHRDPTTGLATINFTGGTIKAIVVRVP
ncbi:MAG TPA: hypothetical protein VIV12_14745 [Streptosporangiaceae bacterium]